MSRLEIQASRLSGDAVTEVVSAAHAAATPAAAALQESFETDLRDSSTPFDWSTIGEVDSGNLHPRLAYGMADMIRSAIAVDNAFPYHSKQSNPMFLPAGKKDLHIRTHPLMEVYLSSYLESLHLCFPFLSVSLLQEDASRLRASGVVDIPTTLLALALGALHRRDRDPTSFYHAMLLFETAVKSLNSLPSTASLVTLQVLLLVSLFSLCSPAGGSTWHLLGLATQVSISLGLHHRKIEANDSEESFVRSAAFWSVYILDRYLESGQLSTKDELLIESFPRLVSLTLCRPLSLVDADITAEVGTWNLPQICPISRD